MYIGNDLQIANPSYKIIDDISSGFNGSTTSFALQVKGVTPVPFPINTQQVTISVNGVIQEPDPTGSAGFKLLGSNIVFSSAPANGHAFFGVINAGADYVTAGSEFPDGTVNAPSFTFSSDQDSGWFRIGSGDIGYSSNGTQILNFDGNGVNLPDNKKVQLGTSSDLQIYHDGTWNHISAANNHPFKINAGTGNSYLQGNAVYLSAANDAERYLDGIKDGAVNLYYDGSKKFETTSIGATVTSILKVQGAEGGHAELWLQADEGDDNADNWLLYHDASNNKIKFANKTSGSYVDKLILDSSGVLNVTDSGKFTAGSSDDLQIYHDGSDSYIYNATGTLYIRTTRGGLLNAAGTEWGVLHTENGAVELYYDGVIKLETLSDGLRTKDNQKFCWGDGYDLQIFHNETNSIIKNSTGYLILQADNFKVTNNGDTESIIRSTANGNVELYYDNAKKVETTSTGAKVTSSGGLGLDVNGGYIRSIGGGPSIVAHKSSNTFCHIGVENNATARAFLAYTNDKAFAIGRRTAYSGDNTGYSGTDITIDATNHAVQLNYNGSNKLTTASYGVNVNDEKLAVLVGSNAGSIVIDRNGHITSNIRPSDDTSIVGGGSGGGSRITFNKNYLEFKTWPYVANVGDAVTYTTRARIDGDGLKFGSDTAAANGLSDYEEGTWTPATGSGTWDTVSGNYTKIGHRVFIRGYMYGPTDSSSSNDVEVTGLPYTASNNEIAGNNFSRASGDFSIMYVNDSSTRIRFIENNGAGTIHYMLHSDFGSTGGGTPGQIEFVGSYRTNS